MSSLNFAPYSSPPSSPKRSAGERLIPNQSGANASPWMSSYQSGASYSHLEGSSSAGATGFGSTQPAATTAESFETRFGWRVDLESALAYATPVLAIFLLLVETKNDYVRFHAFQSLLVSAGLLVLHILLLWSSFLSSFLLLGDFVALGFLALRAYQGAETLERHRLPVVGDLASQWVAEE